ncbi:hypothetical protein, partial [Entomohabitans teleogrylli]|uniref:hypothetical protein n=1 Tax=Entomohabitans teleogrylli TaxID=1384589 RepID=UPI000A7DE3BF
WCGMSTASLDYNFGNMTSTDIASSFVPSMTKPAIMACNKSGVTYNLYLANISTSGRDTIDLGRGVSAKVTVDGESLQTKRTSTDTHNTLNVTVTLSGTPTSTGPIGGQSIGILAVDYY